MPAGKRPEKPHARCGRTPDDARPLLITGGTGRLARAVVRSCVARGLRYRALSRGELDLADAQAVAAALAHHRPWAVVNGAGFACPDAAEADPDACRRANLEGPYVLARACMAAGIPLLAWSSHLVFDGGERRPYLEGDAPAPRGVYATSKLEAERVILGSCPQALLIRAGPLFAPWDHADGFEQAVHVVRAGRPCRAAEDVAISPSYLPHLVAAALDLLIDRECGIWHLANEGAITHADFVRAILRGADLPADRVRGVAAAEMGWVAPRPLYTVLGSSRGLLMPPLDQAIAHYLETTPKRLISLPGAGPEMLLPAAGLDARPADHVQ